MARNKDTVDADARDRSDPGNPFKDNLLLGTARKPIDLLEKLYPNVDLQKRVQWFKMNISSKKSSSILYLSLVVGQSMLSDVLEPIFNYIEQQKNVRMLSLTSRTLERGEVVLVLRLIKIESQNAKLTQSYLEREVLLHKLYPPLHTKRYNYVDQSGVQIPGFWLTAMKNNKVLAEEISRLDGWPLKSLVHITGCIIDNPKGFKLFFYFCTNLFFKNGVLTKTYHLCDKTTVKKAIGTEIEWYPGMRRIVKEKPKEHSENAKPITKIEECESFFDFFSPPHVLDEDGDMDEDDGEELQNLLEHDYKIGTTIRDKIIPDAVLWFLGEAEQAEEDEEEDFDD